MRKPLPFILFIAIWLAACRGTPTLGLALTETAATQNYRSVAHTADSSSQLTPTPLTLKPSVATPTPSSSPSPMQTPSATITPTPIPTLLAQAPTLAAIWPEITPLCPQQPEVLPESLDLENFILLVSPANSLPGKTSPPFTAFIVPLDTLVMQPVPNTTIKDGLDLFRYDSSSDGRTIELRYGNDNNEHFQIWHSSPDGQDQGLVDDYPLPKDHGYFLIDENRYFLYREDLKNNSGYPTAIYDRATDEKIVDFPPFPDGTNIRDIFFLVDAPYMLYYQGSNIDDVGLFNLDTFTSIPVFQWLIGKDWVYSLNMFFLYHDGLLDVIIPRSYGMDLALNLDLYRVQSDKAYEDVMQAVHFPGPNTSELASEMILIDKPRGLLVSRYIKEQTYVKVYYLDFQSMSLQDYCYQIENWYYSSDNVVEAYVSPDGRYVAYTTYVWPVGDTPASIISLRILDLKTGEYANIPDANYVVKGWLTK